LGKVKIFTPILWLKNGDEFIWGAEQQMTFEEIKEYLPTPLVLKAPQSGIPIRLYIAVLTQETEGKEHVITYVSQ
jgi:hypothetical protein